MVGQGSANPAGAASIRDSAGTCGPELLRGQGADTRSQGHPPTMGTLTCDPAPWLTPAPLGRRATDYQIPETSLRRTCGVATLEHGRWARGPVEVGHFPALIPPQPRWGLECVGAQLEAGASGKPLHFPGTQFSFLQDGCEPGILVGP